MQNNESVTALDVEPGALEIDIRGKGSKNQINSSKVENQPQEEETKEKDESVPFFSLFRFADNFDILMMVIGTIGALALGASTPVFILIWGEFTDVFGLAPDLIVEEAKLQMIKFAELGSITLVVGWVMISCWVITG